jgi:hypothetical protein
VLTLPEMEKVCERLDSRLGLGHLDGDNLADIATALLLIIGRLNRVVTDYRGRFGARRDLRMAGVALKAARASLTALQQPAIRRQTFDLRQSVATSQQNVVLALTILGQVNGSDTGVA